MTSASRIYLESDEVPDYPVMSVEQESLWYLKKVPDGKESWVPFGIHNKLTRAVHNPACAQSQRSFPWSQNEKNGIFGRECEKGQ